MNSTIVLLGLILFCVTLEAIDPGSEIVSYGFRVDTTRIMRKITRGLYAPAGNSGVQIKTRGRQRCIDANWAGTDSNGNTTNFYNTFPTTCNTNRPTQRIRFINGRMKVASKTELPNVSGRVPCFDCVSQAANCYITVTGCARNKASQQFFVRVHGRQIDTNNNRIYFSVHSGLHPNKCLTRYFSTEKGGETYMLSGCSGVDAQSFYIDQNYDTEVDVVRRRVRICSTTNSVNDNGIDTSGVRCRASPCPGK